MVRIRSKGGRYIALLPQDHNIGFDVVVTAMGVQAFASRWPCSRLGTQPIRFSFAGNGDLVDVSTRRDGPDVLALSEDAQAFGEKAQTKHRNPETPWFMGRTYEL